MMKHKTSLSILASLLLSMPFAANAASFYCPFTDYFALSIPTSGKILSEPEVNGNVKYTYQSDTFFSLSCADDRRVGSGDVAIDIGFSEENKCNVTLHDGPYVVNPSVTNVKCTGNINFNGIEHLMGSHNYTLKFSN